MTEITPAQNQLDRAKLDAILSPIVHAHGGEVVDVEWKPESGGWVLRVFVEKHGAQANALSTKEAAVTLDLCANVARELSPALDAIDDLIPHAYNLEVSSPGVERALTKPQDFARFAGDQRDRRGEKAKIWLKTAALPRGADAGPNVAGSRVVEGRLESFANDVIVLRDGGRTYDLPFSNVDRARLVFELTTGTKGKNKAGHHQKRDKRDKQTGSKHASGTRPESNTKSDSTPRSNTGEQQ